MRTIFYRVLGDSKDDAHALKISRIYSLDDDLDTMEIAEMAARNYHNQHYGNSDNWPLTFTFHYTEDGPEIFRYLVELRYRPHFIAINLKEAA